MDPLGLLTLISHIALVCALVIFIVFRKRTKHPLYTFMGRYGLLGAFAVALFSTGASLYYSLVMGYEPCSLCWYQRIFLFPQVFLLGMAILRKDTKIIEYALLLTLVGGVIAAYHTFISYGGSTLIPCSAAVSDSCTRRYVYEFGYITIPLMSLTGFALVGFLLWVTRYVLRKNG